jgi:hypothetical protein
MTGVTADIKFACNRASRASSQFADSGKGQYAQIEYYCILCGKLRSSRSTAEYHNASDNYVSPICSRCRATYPSKIVDPPMVQNRVEVHHYYHSCPCACQNPRPRTGLPFTELGGQGSSSHGVELPVKSPRSQGAAYSQGMSRHSWDQPPPISYSRKPVLVIPSSSNG